MLSCLYNLYYILHLVLLGSEGSKIPRYKIAVIGQISTVAGEHRNNEIDTMENRRNAWK